MSRIFLCTILLYHLSFYNIENFVCPTMEDRTIDRRLQSRMYMSWLFMLWGSSKHCHLSKERSFSPWLFEVCCETSSKPHGMGMHELQWHWNASFHSRDCKCPQTPRDSFREFVASHESERWSNFSARTTKRWLQDHRINLMEWQLIALTCCQLKTCEAS